MTLDKMMSKIRPEILEEIDKASATQLRYLIADSTQAIATAVDERNANVKYQAAKEAVADLSEGLKDVKSYQGAKIQYALYKLRGITE